MPTPLETIDRVALRATAGRLRGPSRLLAPGLCEAGERRGPPRHEAVPRRISSLPRSEASPHAPLERAPGVAGPRRHKKHQQGPRTVPVAETLIQNDPSVRCSWTPRGPTRMTPIQVRADPGQTKQRSAGRSRPDQALHCGRENRCVFRHLGRTEIARGPFPRPGLGASELRSNSTL